MKRLRNENRKPSRKGALFSGPKQNIHFCLFSSSEFLPALSQFPVPEISGPLCETLFDVSRTFGVRSIEQQKTGVTCMKSALIPPRSSVVFLLPFQVLYKSTCPSRAVEAGAAQPLRAGRTLWENPQGSRLEGLLWTGQLKEGCIVQCAGRCRDRHGDNDDEDADAVNQEEVCTKRSHKGEKTQH